MITTDVLKTVPLFATLPEQQLAAVAACATFRRYPRGALILVGGAEIDGLYILLSGRAKVLIPDEEGHEVILSIVRPGEFFGEMGLLDELPRSASVETLEPSELMRIAKSDFMRCLAGNFDLVMHIMRTVVKRLRDADRQIESLALLDVYGRVARVLLDRAEQVNGRYVIAQPPPKLEIARMIGASREMVSRVMKELQLAGHIRVENRSIVLLDKLGTRRRPS